MASPTRAITSPLHATAIFPDSLIREYDGLVHQLDSSRSTYLRAMAENMCRVRDHPTFSLVFAISGHRFAQMCTAYILLRECVDVRNPADLSMYI